MTFTIREARPDEFEAVGQLIVDAYREVGERHEDYFDELADVADRAGEVPVLVAVEDGTDRILGTATYVPGPGRFHEGDAGDASLRMLAVAADARGQGVGSALSRACIDRARQGGRAGLSLHTRPFMTDAHAMYERLGFRRVRERDWEFEPGEWLYVYRLDLGG